MNRTRLQNVQSTYFVTPKHNKYQLINIKFWYVILRELCINFWKVAKIYGGYLGGS